MPIIFDPTRSKAAPACGVYMNIPWSHLFLLFFPLPRADGYQSNILNTARKMVRNQQYSILHTYNGGEIFHRKGKLRKKKKIDREIKS